MAPIGALVATACALLAVARVRRPRWLAMTAWIAGTFPAELPILFLAVVLISDLPTLLGSDSSSVWTWTTMVTTAVTVAVVGVLIWRALAARQRLEAALDDGLGGSWRSAVDPQYDSLLLPRRLPWPKIVLVPWPLRPLGVERVANVPYGDDGVNNLADIYRRKDHPPASPVFVHLHGGRFRWGRKSRESRALLFGLASQGWTCISANYTLSATPAEGFPQHLIDIKRLLAWIRRTGSELGADPGVVILSGSSAGAHLTMMAALTTNDPRFQPGFEAVDTSISAGVGLGGYYGPLDGRPGSASDPLAQLGADHPPLAIVHGDDDAYTPVAGARRFVRSLQTTSPDPVVYAELPGGQHTLDLFQSIRFSAVVQFVEQFTAWVLSTSPVAAAEGTACGNADTSITASNA